MAKRKTKEAPLPQDTIAKFKEVVMVVLAVDDAQEVAGDHDGATDLLQQLHASVLPEHFERFAQIIADANDPDFRCPK